MAFDEYVAVCDNHLLRTAAMNLTSLGFVLYVVGWTTLSVLRDRSSRNLGRLFRSLLGLRSSPFLTRDVFRRIRAYNRRDFHPDDRDATALVERWRGELFDDDGVLHDRLIA